jgi:hypothetical protein
MVDTGAMLENLAVPKSGRIILTDTAQMENIAAPIR